MIGEALHAFDVELSSYVFDNIKANADDPEFAAFIEEALDSAVLDYLKALDGAEEPAPLLLSDHELFDLGLTFLAGPFEFDRPWMASSGLHRRSISCVAEIRGNLTGSDAEAWARASRRFARRLEADDVWLHEAIEAVRKWTRELRRLLRAIGATPLLPRPEGTFPTPTYPAPADAPPLQDAEQGADRTDATPLPDLAAVLERLASALEQDGGLAGNRAGPAPEALSKENAARFIGVDVAAVEYLIRTRKLEYVQYGSQRGRVIPVASLRKFLDQHRQLTGDELRRKRRKG
jgi:hypothetical protein